MQTLGLAEAAAFLRCHPQELRQRAKAGQIPAPRSDVPGSSWKRILPRTSARAMLFLGKRCK